MLEVDVFEDGSGLLDHHGVTGEPFGVMYEALDSLQPGEVYVCTGASLRYALWGELMSTRAQHLRAAGAGVDGYHRDTWGVLGPGVPRFSWGRSHRTRFARQGRGLPCAGRDRSGRIVTGKFRGYVE